MGSIPIDIQRRFEQRWAAKFLQQPPSSKPPEKHQLADQGASGKSKLRRAGNSWRVGRQPSPPSSRMKRGFLGL
jgi:hypothetical protein